LNPEIAGYARFVTNHRSPDETEHETRHGTDELAERRRRREEAAEIASEIAEENPDPITRREAIEQGLDEEGLSEEGGNLGQHND
jgi:hypothetical protein